MDYSEKKMREALLAMILDKRTEKRTQHKISCSDTLIVDANNLARYKFVGPTIQFAKWQNNTCDLVMSKIKDVAVGQVASPLGCAYDSARDNFIFTGFDKLLFCTSDGTVLDMKVTGFENPSAIVVMRPGEAIALLDDKRIYVYEYQKRRLNVIADKLDKSCRSLACTADGNLLTVNRAKFVSVVVYDATQFNKILFRLPYPNLIWSWQCPMPCFSDTFGDQIFITDLGSNSLLCLEYSNDQLKVVFQKDLSIVAGQVKDDNKWLSSSGQLIGDVRFTPACSFPYCSNFAVAPSGLLLACDRHSSRMVLFKMGEPKESNRITDVFDDVKMILEN